MSTQTTNTVESNEDSVWLKPKFENIPEELQNQPWAVWKAEQKFDKENKPTGKWGKAPRNPTSGMMVGADKPHLFGTFKEAKQAYESGKYTGIGVLLTGNGIVGIDIDDAASLLEEEPQVKAWLRQAIKSDAYCEISPSNKGFHVILKGDMSLGGTKSGCLEIYSKDRFLTVTGHLVSKMGASK